MRAILVSRASTTDTFSFSALARSLGEGNLAICCQHFLCSTSSLLLSYPSSHFNTSTEGRENNCFQRSSYRLHRVSPISLVLSRSLSLFPPKCCPIQELSRSTTSPLASFKQSQSTIQSARTFSKYVVYGASPAGEFGQIRCDSRCHHL
jgi:hypothetical protein